MNNKFVLIIVLILLPVIACTNQDNLSNNTTQNSINVVPNTSIEVIEDLNISVEEVENKSINVPQLNDRNLSECEIIFNGTYFLLEQSFADENYGYNVPGYFKNQAKDLDFPGDSYFSGDSMAPVIDDIMFVKVWSFTSTDYTSLDDAKTKELEALDSNKDRIIEDVPPRVECKLTTNSGEDAYLVKTNFYRKSNNLAQIRYDLFSYKNRKSFQITISIQHSRDFDFTTVEQNVSTNKLARSIMSDFYLK
jgi:hypothetical protein